MSTWRKSSIRRRLLVSVLLIVAVIHTAGVVVSIAAQRDSLLAEMQAQGRILTRIMADSLVAPLWDLDLPQVERALSALRANESFVSARVVEASGAEIAVVADHSPPPETHMVFERTLTLNSGGTPETIGQLTLVLSNQNVMAYVERAVVRGLAVGAISLILICLAIVMIARIVSAPLIRISHAITGIRDGNLEDATPEIDRGDELGRLARAVESFRGTAIEMRAMRAINEQRTQEDRQRIRQALASTQDAVLIFSEAGEILFFNPKAQDLFPDVTGKTGRAFSDAIRPSEAQIVRDAVSGRRSMEISSAVLCTGAGSDEQFQVHLRINPIVDSDNRHLGTVILATDNRTQARYAEKIRYLAEHDSLTGLPNRRMLENALAECFDREGETGALLLMDLDRFKAINDTLGHPTGDELLMHVAACLRGMVGDSGLAARLGGDEIAVLLTHEGAAERVRQLGLEIVEAMSKPQPVGARTLKTGASIGIAFVGGDDASGEDIMRRADLALHEAKRRGGGQVVVFEDKLERECRRKAEIEARLRVALESRSLSVAYQQQRALCDDSLCGFEALARWHESELGSVGPGEFIAVAEETGLIGELSYQILAESCATAVRWRAEGFRGRVSVNISPKLFAEDVSELVLDVLMATRCPADMLEIEITEAVLLSDDDCVRRQIDTLRAHGVSVALDDFGMGYSSLSYLQHFPVDRIKIDRAFVSNLSASAETRAIVRAICDLGHGLGMKVTGEGAESERDLELLAACGADSVQGFVHGGPMPVDAASQILAASRRWNVTQARAVGGG